MRETHDELMVLMTCAGAEADLASAVEHVRQCALCQASAPKLGVAIDALERATVGRFSEVPPAGGVERLLARVREGRLSYFVAQVAGLFDITTEEAGSLLKRAERNEGWEQGPAPGVQIMPVNPGPRVPEALTALVKLAGGATFPLHPHFGPERVMVLEGGSRVLPSVQSRPACGLR